MEYKIETKEDEILKFAILDLEESVNKLIEEGWEPIGALVVTLKRDGKYSVMQNLIKKQ